MLLNRVYFRFFLLKVNIFDEKIPLPPYFLLFNLLKFIFSGDTSVVIFKMEAAESKIATVVVRGATENYMDDIERAIDDGVNTYKGGYLIKKKCSVRFLFVIKNILPTRSTTNQSNAIQ